MTESYSVQYHEYYEQGENRRVPIALPGGAVVGLVEVTEEGNLRVTRTNAEGYAIGAQREGLFTPVSTYAEAVEVLAAERSALGLVTRR